MKEFSQTASRTIFLAAIALAAGCASYDGRGLVPGQSRAEDVQSLMGTPSEKLPAPEGGSVWYYNRNPGGFHAFAVRIGPDGVMRGIEQRLTVANMQKLLIGTTSARQVRELLGPPWRVSANMRKGGEYWDYRMYDDAQLENNLSVDIGADGIVRGVYLLRDVAKEPTGM